jgi:hypothetical protein
MAIVAQFPSFNLSMADLATRISAALREDIPIARLMLKRLVDDFVLSPVVENGSKFLDSRGKIELRGLLGDDRTAYTLQNSGDRI